MPRLFHEAHVAPHRDSAPHAAEESAGPTQPLEPEPEAVELEAPVPLAGVVAPAPIRPPLRRAPRERNENYKRALIGSGIGAAIVLLVLLLLLLLFWTAPGGGDGIAQEEAGAGKANSGESQGSADGEGASLQNADDNNDSLAGGGSSEEPSSTQSDETTTKQPPIDAALSIAPLAPIASNTGEANGGNGNGGQRNGAAGRSAGDAFRGGGRGRDSVSEFFGVKVRGSIALVCDISPSMSSDFPVLVRELRKKFHKNTPLILVVGCEFYPPNPHAPPPQKLIDLGKRMPYVGNEFADDPHVYLASSTTDAIIFAVATLKRDTVMFNNDLQDGGSESAITAFEELRKKRRFRLSGRSLNCEAPACLLEFIKDSGGDFKVDPISRSPGAAQHWSP